MSPRMSSYIYRSEDFPAEVGVAVPSGRSFCNK
jgi:hypothetical protein